MPELPEVETIARGLSERLIGKTLVDVRVLGPKMLRSDPATFRNGLLGRRLNSIRRHGKALFLSFGVVEGGGFPSAIDMRMSEGNPPPSVVLRLHLGMTGQLVFEPASSSVPKHTHFIFRFDGLKDDLRHRDIRRFGRIGLFAEDHAPLAPDAWLSSDQEIFSALRKKRGMLKHVLLNQNVIAGLGNIYVDESLYRTQLHPKKLLERVSDDKLRKLCDSIRLILGKSIGVGGTSFRNYVDAQGGRGGFKDWLHVYGKQGTPCRRCKKNIRRTVVAGRGTHYCPTCQRA